jgi:hypothetical protein
VSEHTSYLLEDPEGLRAIHHSFFSNEYKLQKEETAYEVLNWINRHGIKGYLKISKNGFDVYGPSVSCSPLNRHPTYIAFHLFRGKRTLR